MNSVRAQIAQSLLDTRILMADNMARLMERGDTLSDLEHRAHHLSVTSEWFTSQTLPWYKRMCFCPRWRNYVPFYYCCTTNAPRTQ